jgi:hypothetical protein
MKKLLIVSAFLLAVGVTVGSTPVRANIPVAPPNCDVTCTAQTSGGTACTCQPGTTFAGRKTTCSNWVWDCTYP